VGTRPVEDSMSCSISGRIPKALVPSHHLKGRPPSRGNSFKGSCPESKFEEKNLLRDGILKYFASHS
jgi:hypothetical protein